MGQHDQCHKHEDREHRFCPKHREDPNGRGSRADEQSTQQSQARRLQCDHSELVGEQYNERHARQVERSRKGLEIKTQTDCPTQGKGESWRPSCQRSPRVGHQFAGSRECARGGRVEHGVRRHPRPLAASDENDAHGMKHKQEQQARPQLAVLHDTSDDSLKCLPQRHSADSSIGQAIGHGRLVDHLASTTLSVGDEAAILSMAPRVSPTAASTLPRTFVRTGWTRPYGTSR